MKNVLIGALGALGLVFAAGVVLLVGGFIDVAADTPHYPAIYRIIEFARDQAIDRRIAAIRPPADLNDGERIRRGAGNYDAMCSGCHLSPGEESSEIRKGLYPMPPDLARPAKDTRAGSTAPARQFWIIKHGIKASGMSAWSKGGMDDADLWDLVAFLQKLPTLTPPQYRQLVESSEGHHHAGMVGEHAGQQNPPAEIVSKERTPHRHPSGHRHPH